MVKNLELSDFRAIRRILEPDDFALTDGEPDPPWSDLIDEEAWDHLMTLPGHVAITTTGYQGSRISLLNDIASDWLESTPLRGGIVSTAMTEVHEAFYSSTFNQMHGFYREGISTLRNVLETIVLSTLCVLEDDKEKWGRWENGEEIRFGNICSQLRTRHEITALESAIEESSGEGLFRAPDKQHPSWAQALYKKLCRFSHARGDSTNFSLWKSNGPIYSAEGFKASYETFLEVHAFCLILVKLMKPKLRLKKTASLTMRSDSIALYMEPPYRETCEAARTALWPVRRNHTQKS